MSGIVLQTAVLCDAFQAVQLDEFDVTISAYPICHKYVASGAIVAGGFTVVFSVEGCTLKGDYLRG